MVGNNLFCTYFRCVIKGNFLFKPRCFHHSRLFVLAVSYGAVNYIANAVYHSYSERSVVSEVDFNRFLRNKLRLGCHYSSSRGGLRKFVKRSAIHRLIGNVRQHKRIHKLFNKCRFARSYRANNSDIHIAVCSA